MNRTVQIALVAIVVIALLGTAIILLPPRGDREALYQEGSLDDLVKGRLDGGSTVGEVLGRGDIGLGTFNALNGEMIVIDGRCYRARRRRQRQ